MNARLPNLNVLRTFVVAARSNSFVKAADELCVTPAAVSRSIKLLEEQVGCSLFYRLHRKVSLTREGHLYAERLTNIFGEISSATELIAAERQTRPILVCAYPTTIINWLIPSWSKLLPFDPAFSLKLVSTHHANIDFKSQHLDVAIVTKPIDQPELQNAPLFTGHLVAVCSPDFNARVVKGPRKDE